MATRYTVLKIDPGTTQWTMFNPEVEADGPRSAIREAIGNAEEGAIEGEYVAVPSRSWKPVKVEPRQDIRFA